MRRVNNFNKKKKKEFKARRTAATSDTIRVQTRSSRPSTPVSFRRSEVLTEDCSALYHQEGWCATEGSTFRSVKRRIYYRHHHHFFLSPINFFFPTIRGSCSERTKFLNYRTCDTPLFKMNLYRLVWNGGSIYMYYRFWIDFCSNEKESEPVLLQKIFLIIIIKI